MNFQSHISSVAAKSPPRSLHEVIEAEFPGILYPFQHPEQDDVTEKHVRIFYDTVASRGWYGLLVATNDHVYETVVPWVMEKLPSTGTILDIGCAGGALTNYYASKLRGAKFIGIDLSREILKLARRHAGELGLANVAYVQATALQVPARRFDAAVARSACTKHRLSQDTSTLSQTRTLTRKYAPSHAQILYLWHCTHTFQKCSAAKWLLLLNGLDMPIRTKSSGASAGCFLRASNGSLASERL